MTFSLNCENVAAAELIHLSRIGFFFGFGRAGIASHIETNSLFATKRPRCADANLFAKPAVRIQVHTPGRVSSKTPLFAHMGTGRWTGRSTEAATSHRHCNIIPQISKSLQTLQRFGMRCRHEYLCAENILAMNDTHTYSSLSPDSGKPRFRFYAQLFNFIVE